MSMFYGKIPQTLRRAGIYGDRVYPGQGRPPPEPLEESVQFVPGTLGKDFQVSVKGITDPARKPEPTGFAVGGITEAHPLDPALNQDKKGGSGHFTAIHRRFRPPILSACIL
jgi:hypothetical protein